jgi:uncharacterized protein (DUF58 family)
LIDGQFLSKLDRLSLALGRDLIHGLMGEHQAVRRTTGIEFADYRQYSHGDDLRRVDWNAYARLGTLHVRQAQAEQDTILYLLVDASPSMEFGHPSKFLTARRLAAALGYVALTHLDSVILSTPGVGRNQKSEIRNQPITGAQSSVLSPQSSTFRGRAESSLLFSALQDLHVGSAADFDGLMAGWSSLRGGSPAGRLAIIISDLLLDGYQDGVRRLVSEGFQVALLHILSPDEIHPPESGDLELIDSETGEQLEIRLGVESLTEYKRRLGAWLEETEQWCRSNGAGYLRLQSDWDVERVLLDTLRRRRVTA